MRRICRRLSCVYCRRLTQDSEKLPTKLPVVSDGKMMREVKNEIEALAAAGGSEVGGTRGSFRRAGAVECRAITFPAKVFDEAELARSRRRIVIKGFGYHRMNRTRGGGGLSHWERSRDVEVVATRASVSVT